MGKFSSLLLLSLLFFSSWNSFADTIAEPETIKSVLKSKGYENIVVFTSSDTLFIGAENRLYRWTPKACTDIFMTVLPLVDRQTTVCLVTLQQGIPYVKLSLSAKIPGQGKSDTSTVMEFSRQLNVSMNFKNALKKKFNSGFFNPSFSKIDLVIYPQIKIQIGNFDDPFKSQFNIAPSFEMTFFRGLKFMAQLIIPLQNDLEANGNNVRPGIVALSQTFRLPKNFFGLISVGYFTNNRYGVNGELRKYFMNGKISAGFTGGVTGYAELADYQWNYSSVNLFTWFADAAYRWSKYDLTLKIGYGSFLNNDQGWRVDAYRQFREVTIGFFATSSEGFYNGGFYFRIPLPPGRYSTKHFARIRPESYFSWEYKARGMSEYGKSFSTGSTITDLFHNMNPDYLQHTISSELLEKLRVTEKK